MSGWILTAALAVVGLPAVVTVAVVSSLCESEFKDGVLIE